MSQEKQPRRLQCVRCQRPASHCVCAHIPSLSNHTRVLVLQHPDEAKHPLNTARLAVLGLQHAELWVGEQFPRLDDWLDNWLAAAGQAYLLFPPEPGDQAQAVNPASARVAERGVAATGLSSDCAPSDCTAVAVGRPCVLIVPDGTWRQARKLLRANPVLFSLPRVSLPPAAPSEYRVRKATEPGAVSTVEAIVRALAVLEPQADYQALLQPFRALVQQQIEAMGPEVSRRHHPAAKKIPQA